MAEKQPREDARERILTTAYDLFSRYGTRAVGIDRVVAEAGVAKMSLYRHFRSKEDLIVAVLDRRSQVWTRDFVFRGITDRADTPAGQLLAIFDVFDEWFRQPQFEGCTFCSVLLEYPDPDSAVRQASSDHLRRIRESLTDLARAAGVADPATFARQWQILMKGAILSAAEGDVDAAQVARQVAVPLLERELAATRP